MRRVEERFRDAFASVADEMTKAKRKPTLTHMLLEDTAKRLGREVDRLDLRLSEVELTKMEELERRIARLEGGTDGA